MNPPERSSGRPEASPEIVSASSQESLPKRARDSHDAPERLHGDDGNDDHDDHPHAAFHEADWYGHGDDDRLVSDISERYPKPLPDDQKTVAGSGETTTFDVERDAPASCRSGRATSPSIVGKPPEIVAESSRDGHPYTIPLHNRDDDPLESGGNRGRTRGARPYTNRLHIRGSGIVLNDNRYFYRRRVPALLRATVGKNEIWRSLGTDSLSTARRRSNHAAAMVEHIFAVAAHEALTL